MPVYSGLDAQLLSKHAKPSPSVELEQTTTPTPIALTIRPDLEGTFLVNLINLGNRDVTCSVSAIEAKSN